MSSVRTAGGLQPFKGISYRNAANALVNAAGAVIRDAGNVVRPFSNPLAAAASPDAVSGIRSTTGTVATSSTTASASGGTAPLSYAWSIVSGSGWTIGSPASASTSFTSPSLLAGEQEEATFKCVVTDASGATAETNIVTATATNIGSGGGELIP